MTCVVGIIHQGAIYMGADSAGVAGLELQRRADAKVFVKTDLLFGFTSSFRMGQLLRYSLSIPKRHPDKDVMEFLTTEFVDALRGCLKGGGFARKDSEVEQAGVFLLGYAGRLFRIEGDYQVAELLQPFHACGCGESYAMGAMYATPGMPPRARIELALRAAEEHSAGVRGPFRVESIG
jgi:ATP-dependent protease HslVU (ClpYQ) peptidase subunit